MSSIAKEINENGDASVTIIDMRHAEARVLTNLADINGQSKIEEYLDEQKKRPPKLGQELLYNINLIAEQHNNEVEINHQYYHYFLITCHINFLFL